MIKLPENQIGETRAHTKASELMKGKRREMNRTVRKAIWRSRVRRPGVIAIGVLTSSMVILAQDPLDGPQPAANQSPTQDQTLATSGGWRRVGDTANQTQSANSTPAPVLGGGPQGYPHLGGEYPQQQYPPQYPQQNGQYPQQGQQVPPTYYPPIPAQLTLRPGTYITARVNQPLSSDHNQAGDGFTATLVRPIVVDGVVVAVPGQTIGGRVAEAQKAGRVSGTSRLGLQLTDLTLVDGQQFPIHSQLVSRQGNTSVGRDAGAIAATTATGAAIGAAAGWGVGAAIGAGAGATAGIIGVLLTRGEPTVVAPEQILTFQLEAPLTFSTEHSSQAYHYIEPGEYDQPYASQGPPPRSYGYAPAPAYAAYPPPYYYGYGYGYGYPYAYWGPSLYLGFGGGYYYRGGYYHGGYWGGGYHGGGVHVGHH
jgi:hypothetical protein